MDSGSLSSPQGGIDSSLESYSVKRHTSAGKVISGHAHRKRGDL